MKPWRWLSLGSVENERDTAQSWRENCPQVPKGKTKKKALSSFKEKRKKKSEPEENGSEQQDRDKMGIYWRKLGTSGGLGNAGNGWAP